MTYEDEVVPGLKKSTGSKIATVFDAGKDLEAGQVTRSNQQKREHLSSRAAKGRAVRKHRANRRQSLATRCGRWLARPPHLVSEDFVLCVAAANQVGDQIQDLFQGHAVEQPGRHG